MGIDIKGFGKDEKNGLFSLAKGMLSSWLGKPQELSTEEWLSNNLIEHLGEEAAKVAENLMGGIDSFNDSLRQIEEKCAAGSTKEEWLQGKLNDMPAESEQAKGEYLSSVNTALAIGNTAVQKILHNSGETIELKESEENITGEPAEWNKLSIKAMTGNLVQQVVLSGIGGGALSASCERVEIEAGESLADTIDPASEPVGSEVDVGFKAVAAGALKVAGDKGIIPFITKKTPLCVLSTIACWGVESVRTVGQVFRGQLSVTKAVERMGRVSSAAVGDLCVNGVAAKFLTAIPIIGPVVGVALGESITKAANNKVTQMVYEGFKKIQPVVTQVAETTYKAVNKVIENVKKIGNKVLEFLGF